MTRSRWLPFALGACFFPAASAQATHVHPMSLLCPDDTPPKFIGHPFQPFFCPGLADEEAAASSATISEVAISSANIPKADGKASLKALAGTWQGIIFYGEEEYEILLGIDVRGRDCFAWAQIENSDTHAKNIFKAEFSPAQSNKRGEYAARVFLEALPKMSLEGRLWSGVSSVSAFSREFVLMYAGRPDFHRLRFSLEGKDKLKFSYAYVDPSRGELESDGEFSRLTPPQP